jgi:hypothetical protein
MTRERQPSAHRPVKIAGFTPGAAEPTIENVYKSRDIYTNPNVVITMQARSRFVKGVEKLKRRSVSRLLQI